MTFTHSFSEVARKAGKPLLVCYSKVDHPAVVSLKDRFWGEHVEFFELKRNQDLRYLHQENLTELRKLKELDVLAPETIL